MGTVGRTRRDRMRNRYIREEVKMEEIQNQIESSGLRWFGHVKRMDEYRFTEWMSIEYQKDY
jgi:hypothetical protein